MEHCSRCNGYGVISGYSHVKSGTCFKCGGKNTRGNWQEIEKAERKERFLKAKRVEELTRKIYNLEKVVKLFIEHPPENDEEKEFLQSRKDLIKKYKLEHNELNPSCVYVID
jgi:hypothetical protein